MAFFINQLQNSNRTQTVSLAFIFDRHKSNIVDSGHPHEIVNLSVIRELTCEVFSKQSLAEKSKPVLTQTESSRTYLRLDVILVTFVDVAY
jgi:hypothetical protein